MRGDLEHGLKAGGLAAANIRWLSDSAFRLFLSDPSIASLSACAVFSQIAQHLHDDQGVPTSVLDMFQSELQPALQKWLATDESFFDASEISHVATKLASCIRRMS